MKIDYFLNGIVNGEYLEVKGTGKIDDESGGYHLDFHSIIAPDNWDPGIILLICCGNFTFYSCKFKNDKIIKSKEELLPLRLGTMVNSQRQGTIINENGDYIVSLKAKGFLYQKEDTLYSRSIILDGFSKLGEYGGIKSIDSFQEELIPSISKHATGLSRYSINTNNGEKLTGETFFPYKFENFHLSDKIIMKISDLNNGYEDFIKSEKQKTSISAKVYEQ